MQQDYCCICLSVVADEHKKGTVVDCSHAFCESCLSQWVTRKRVCPLCKGPITAIRTMSEHGVVETPCSSMAEPKPATEADLGCLDQSFFLPEVQRLAVFVSETYSSFMTEQRQPGPGDAQHLRLTKLCGEITEELDEYQCALASDACLHFDPNMFLSRLYDLQSCVVTMRRGRYPSSYHAPKNVDGAYPHLPVTTTRSTHSTHRTHTGYNNEEDYYDEADYDYDFDGEGGYGLVGKKKNRRTTTREARKPPKSTRRV